ncbi:NAD(P)H-binding protein [Roseofilum sp. Belize Diploria]|uniref:NAD(P)H-binding protein n=1 Tax=Roseofilum sp. Belize Diploria TaxID=2821501 RepID=UPI001B005E81|nr:NAD(P)H-binding protein [Roseofilum sp. Belize Diploria]MBP0007256.1 NAD(P)H-binding protein [Roseofilum sp. Belize Diploria]
MKAFVAGATGETGKRIVHELVKREIPTIAFVRDRQPARSILPDEVELVTGDLLNRDSLKQALGDSTVVLSALGARPSFDPTGPYQVDYEGIKNLVNVCQEKQIQQLVLVSSLCVSQFFHPLNLFWLVLWWKKQGEDYLIKSGLPYTIVRPGGLKNEENSQAIVMSKADTLFEGSIPRQKVAQVCVEALFCPESRNKIVEIVTQEQAAEKSFSDLFASV